VSEVTTTTPRHAARGDEDDDERFDREFLELLNELRVAMPGVQVLFGFLLAVPFQQRFAQVSDFQRQVFLGTLLCAAVATALFVSTTTYHRIMFRRRDKPHLIRYGSAMLLGGSLSLALAMSGAVLLIVNELFASRTAATVSALIALTYGALWFGYPLSRRVRGERSW
jgi:hypothetical protein